MKCPSMVKTAACRGAPVCVPEDFPLPVGFRTDIKVRPYTGTRGPDRLWTSVGPALRRTWAFPYLRSHGLTLRGFW